MVAAFHKLPVLRAKEIIKILERAGFTKDRQKGSHIVMKHPENGSRTVVPVHRGETVSKGLLMEIITQADLSLDEFLSYLKK